MNRWPQFIGGLLIAVSASCSMASEPHPRLLLTASDLTEFDTTWRSVPAFSDAVTKTQKKLDAIVNEPLSVPKPVDAGGGYTHETHKRNARLVFDAGMLFQWTGEERYADYARRMLLEYAQMYPTLGEHPKKKEQAPGRLFWQSLNESMWLVYVIQGYDAIVDTLTAADRQTIETKLLRPMAKFLSLESPRTFNLIHNHGTWATAAVGMTGYSLGDDSMVQQALLGLSLDGKGGFLRQLDELFSPDGYYTEGPYYQRFALMPFVVFARVIENNNPDMAIFDRRDGILKKAIRTTVQLSYAGKFFPINDAIKDKGLDTTELSYGLSIGYAISNDPGYLAAAEFMGPLILNGDGLRLAKGMTEVGLIESTLFETQLITDGADGQQGALGILRSGGNEQTSALVFKATSQGMGHGHFDRLAWLYYDNGREVIRDYGAARFLNVVQKNGGHYLRENNSWAKQSVAHNTLVVDETSHFDGDSDAGDAHPAGAVAFHQSPALEVLSSKESNAYPDTAFKRTLARLQHPAFDHPLVIDVVHATSETPHQYDLPLYVDGQIISISAPVKAATQTIKMLGASNGYQHLLERARAQSATADSLAVTWILANRFYTMTHATPSPTDVIFTEIGATDPKFNLRRESGLMLRVSDANEHVFTTVFETHGEYNGSQEFTIGSESIIDTLQHQTVATADWISITLNNGEVIDVMIDTTKPNTQCSDVEVAGRSFTWQGPTAVFSKQLNTGGCLGN